MCSFSNSAWSSPTHSSRSLLCLIILLRAMKRSIDSATCSTCRARCTRRLGRTEGDDERALGSRNHTLRSERVLRHPVQLALHLVDLVVVLSETVPFPRIEHELHRL